MATITTSQYLDDAARTAGEAMTIGSGARLTIRTDSRIHATAPASQTGSMSSVGFQDIGGEYYIDATQVRWLPFTSSGLGSTPAIGTSITQGDTTGYFLGLWDGVNFLYSTGMVTSGFMKFREVIGAFTEGALTLAGTDATASGPDVVGWIELAYDAGTNLTIPRVGKMISRGAWFECGESTGLADQIFYLPTTSSSHTNNYLPGVWIETDFSSGEYEFYPTLNGSTNGWARQNIGYPTGFPDKRVKFVQGWGSTSFIIGASSSSSATYAMATGQASTYTNLTVSVSYTWANDVLTVSSSPSTHLLESGMQVGLAIASGDATTGIYTATVIDAYTFTVPLTGSGTGGLASMRAGVSIAFTAHGLFEGESVHCDFTSGTGVDGVYTVWRRINANTYAIAYPLTATLTTGNVTCRHTATVTLASHGFAVGNDVYLEFTSGTLTSGVYTIKTVLAGSFTVNAASLATSGNVNVNTVTGYIPPVGCRIRIPNIFIAECATGTRANNSVPNATIASRPELTTTAAGDVDLEYIYAISFYTGVIGQAYRLRLHHCAFQDRLNISEIATALDIDDIGVGMYSAQDARPVNFTSCFAGGTIKNVVAFRGNTPGTTDHAFELIYCNDIVCENIKAGIIQYVRSTGIPIQITTCQRITINGANTFNGTGVNIATSSDIEINDLDYCDRFMGRTNSTTPYGIIYVNAGCINIKVDGVTVGLNGTIPDCHPYSQLFYAIGSQNLIFRNFGSKASPISLGTWAVDTYGCAYATYLAGSNSECKVQKIYVTRARTGLIYSLNSDKNILYDRVSCTSTNINTGTGTPRASLVTTLANLNADTKCAYTGTDLVTGQTSVYGSHFYEQMYGDYTGSLLLAMNEATDETDPYVTVTSGTVLFNSSGGVEMREVGAQAVWETSYYIKSYSAFDGTNAPVMSGGTITNYTLEYDIDINDGNGYSASWTTLTVANLAAENISNGFKLKIRITTAIANTTAITFLRIYMISTPALLSTELYPMDEVPITVTVLDASLKTPIQNARVYIKTNPGGVSLMNTFSDSTGEATDMYTYLGDQAIIGRVRSASSSPLYKPNDFIGTITDEGFSTIVLMVSDE